MDHTAVGQTVHLASRMEQMATPGSVMVTKDALRLAEGFVQVKSLGPIGAVLQYDIVSGFQWRRQVGFAKHLPQIYFRGPAHL
jgi:class 3 adenylate cyclase